MRPIGERYALRLPRFIARHLGQESTLKGDGTRVRAPAVPGAPAAPAAPNPFLAARTEFTNAFGDLARGKRNWQLMAYALVGQLTLVTIAYVRLAQSARVVPYVVHVDRLGQVVAVGTAEALKRPDERLIASQLAQFVRAIRTVLPASAALAQAEMLRRGYAFVAPGAAAFLNEYFSAPGHDPRVLGTRLSRQVDVVSVLRVPNSDVWRLQWTETERSNEPADPIRPVAWEGYVSVKLIPLASPESIEDNPLGLQITSVSWTQVAPSAAAWRSAAPLDAPGARDTNPE